MLNLFIDFIYDKLLLLVTDCSSTELRICMPESTVYAYTDRLYRIKPCLQAV